MSADNGIYILELKDECRVCDRSAIESLYCDVMAETQELYWPEVYSTYKNAPFFKDVQEAVSYAVQLDEDMYNQCGFFTEYGVVLIKEAENKTWGEIIQLARKEAEKDISVLSTKDERWKTYISYLENILKETAYL